jgi:cell division transport system permease protein
MQHWLNQHRQAIQLVLQRFASQWVSTLTIVLVIGITLAIPSLIYVMTSNAQQLIGNVKSESKISLFLKQDINQTSIDNIATELKSKNEIKTVKFVSKEDALKLLIDTSKDPESIRALEDNPLPDAFFIEPVSIDESNMIALVSQLENIVGVDEVILDSNWIKRLGSLLAIGKKAVWIFGLLLSFAIIAVISNTIRMQIVTHKDEIEVSELFGATKSFIRRPFLYLGSAYGLGGGIFASIILFLIVTVFNQNVAELAQTYQADFLLNFSKLSVYGSLMLLATVIGWLAAYFAVSFNRR